MTEPIESLNKEEVSCLLPLWSFRSTSLTIWWRTSTLWCIIRSTSRSLFWPRSRVFSTKSTRSGWMS